MRLKDHPRECGEHFNRTVAQLKAAGSSPRMRGAQGEPPGRFRQAGIIPANAGSTHQRPRDTHLTWDHPRECGEHCSVVAPQKCL